MDAEPDSCRYRGLTNEKDTWSARCVETRTPGAASGLGKRTGRKTSTAPQPDSTESQTPPLLLPSPEQHQVRDPRQSVAWDPR